MPASRLVRPASCLLLAGSLLPAAHASDGLEALATAVTSGKPTLELRARVEHVDNELPANPDDATASTLRTRLGFTTAAWNALTANVEFEHIAAASDRAYNTTLNGVPRRAVIPDPTGSELNQFWLRYAGMPGTTVQLGRNRISLDNARWLGNSGWRQNEQTYDGVVLTNKSLKNVEATCAFLTNANIPLYGNVLNVGWAATPALKATGYLYQFGFKQNTAARYDTRTIGLRTAGTLPLNADYKLGYTAEYARQEGFDQAPEFVKGNYLLGELAVIHKLATAKLGYEVLGSNDGLYGVQTPLATLHAHNGWADLFLNTPRAGLQDAYLTLSGSLAKAALTASAHRYEADADSASLGHEFNLQASLPLAKQLSLLAKYARYQAGELVVPTAASTTARVSDTEKIWLQLEYKL